MSAEKYLNRIENKRVKNTPLYTKEEMLSFAEKYAKHYHTEQLQLREEMNKKWETLQNCDLDKKLEKWD